MAGYIFKRGLNGSAEYWTGEMDCGEPIVSPHRCDAYVFTNKGAALQCSDTHAALCDSDVWKVVLR